MPEKEKQENTNHDETSAEKSNSENCIDEGYTTDEAERMWSALSFFIILIVLGIPLWWQVTKVERSYFPHSEIESLRDEKINFLLRLQIHTCKASPSTIVNELNVLFKQSKLYTASIDGFNEVVACNATFGELEADQRLHHQEFGTYQLIEVDLLKSGEILMGKHRTAYFSSVIKPSSIYAFLQKVLLDEEMFIDSVSSIINPGSISENVNYLRKVRPSLEYDVVFTVVNPQPEKISINWDMEDIINDYFKPTLDSISLLGKFNIKSQSLYSIDLQQKPQKDNHGEFFVINKKQIPHIITPLETKIGSGVAANPCINFVLYVSKCEHTPTFFMDDDGKLSHTMLSARWGGVQLVNANTSVCSENVELILDAEAVMRRFLFQLRTLVGLKELLSSNSVVPYKEVRICPWEQDFLYRMRISEQFVLSRMTLTSLSQLLGEIGNIVINKEVGAAVENAVLALRRTEEMTRKDSMAALDFSTRAYQASEFAFTHPSLLALLYFPDDQKYAVYIPLFLPVMIPVLLSLKNIFKWFTGKNKSNKTSQLE